MSSRLPSDIEIARNANKKPIENIASKLKVPAEALYCYGHYIAKIDQSFINSCENNPQGKLILVTAITPTPAGEGKTTLTVGLGDGLWHIGKKSIVCIREPSLGPCLGMKGGAAGGGMAQVVPMENINLHFTGDLHAISTAHNLLSAILDNHLHWGNKLDIDCRQILWKRVVDLNDRSLRKIVIGLGGSSNGYPREDNYDITVASEIMAIFCLSRNLKELEQRLGNIIVAYNRKGEPVTARDLSAHSAMAVLLKDALMPNLVQTLENNPAFIHGGPFANIAHGCNSLIATETALKLADYVVTEAGFGADLGAEKFFNIKCRKSGLKPSVVVIVATVRALKMHGGITQDKLKVPNVDAIQLGLKNLAKHLENLHKFQVPVVVAINHFSTDSKEEIEAIASFCAKQNVEVFTCKHWEKGGKGADALAKKVVALADKDQSEFKLLYDDNLSLFEKIKTIAFEIYGANVVAASAKILEQLAKLEQEGYGTLPICMAKTQYSFSTDPYSKGAPKNFEIAIREVRLSAGAGFVVVICGDILTMPGLPRKPAAESIRLNENGKIEGLF